MAQGSVRCSADTLSSLRGMEGHRASVLQPTKWGLGPSLCFMKDKVKGKSLSHVQFFATPWTVAYQAPPSMGFFGQEYGSGLPFPSPEDLPSPGIEPGSPALRAHTLPSESPGNERQKQNPHTCKKPSWAQETWVKTSGKAEDSRHGNNGKDTGSGTIPYPFPHSNPREAVLSPTPGLTSGAFSPFLAPSSLGTKPTNLVPCFLSSSSSTLNPSVLADTLTHCPGEPDHKATSGHSLPCQGCWGPRLP